MLGQILMTFSAMNFGYIISTLLEQGILILLEQISRRFPKKRGIGVEDRISALSDDLLVQILLHVPTKDAVSTMILSKRWRSIWTMVPKLDYLEINDRINKVVIGGLLGRLLERFFSKNDQQRRCIWRFIDESIRVHKAPVLETLAVELGPQCSSDVGVDVGKWITKAVDRRVRELGFSLKWSAEHICLPRSLYTCDTLVSLGLSNKILVDAPSRVCLPSLKGLGLYSVVYKDDDSLTRLLLGCHILKHLIVERHHQDNLKICNIKHPLLECLAYDYVELGLQNEGIEGTLVIDCPALKKIFITDYSRDSCLISKKPRLHKAYINVLCYPDDKFMTSISSVIYLELILSDATLAWFNTINFPHLMDCKIIFLQELDWLEPLMVLLRNSPHLKVLSIDKTFNQLGEELPLSWNQSSSVPGCLSTYLEIFEWEGYGGRNEEREFVRYIFANSNCLKRAGFSFKSTRKTKMMKELESMSRISTSSQLLFSTQLEYMNIQNEMSD